MDNRRPPDRNTRVRVAFILASDTVYVDFVEDASLNEHLRQALTNVGADPASYASWRIFRYDGEYGARGEEVQVKDGQDLRELPPTSPQDEKGRPIPAGTWWYYAEYGPMAGLQW